MGIGANLLLLGYCKYCDFFIENVNFIFQTSYPLKLGVIIRQSAEQPDHLAVPDITILPMVPEDLPAV